MKYLGRLCLTVVVFVGLAVASAGTARAQCYGDYDCAGYSSGCQQYYGYCDFSYSYYYGYGYCNYYPNGPDPDGTICGGAGAACSAGVCCSAGMKSCDGASCVGAGTCCSAADCPYANGSGACSGNGGSCSLAACNPGYKACNGACIPDGTCCSSADCPGTANGAGLCSGAGGSCSITCNGGYKACGGACIPDATCCGSGDCPGTANGVGICSGAGGSCSLGCNMGFKLCGNQCIPNGTCCSTGDCPAPANGTPVCSGVGGSCSVSCNGGYKGCGGACIPNAQCCTSADCPNDAGNHRHGVCVVGGSCIFACDSGYKACGGTCIPNSACCNNGDCTTPTNGCYKTQGTCAAGGVCTYAYNDGATCNADSDACTPNDKCLSGSCVPDTANRVKCVQRDCHSAPACNRTTGNCDDANLTNGTACGGNGCAVAVGACTNGSCSVAPKDCTSLNSDCKVGMCDASAAVGTPCASVNKLNGLACNVADKCIIAPACNGGECVGERKTCTPSSSCHVAECNPSTGECEETVAPAGTSCANEGSSCTQNASCDVNGSCNGDLVPDGTPCDMDCGEISAACVTGQCICISNNEVKEAIASDDQPADGSGAGGTDGANGCAVAGHTPSTPLFWAFLAASLMIVIRRRRVTPDMSLLRRLALAAIVFVALALSVEGKARAQCYSDGECGGQFISGCTEYYGFCDLSYYYIIGYGICMTQPVGVAPDGTDCGGGTTCSMGYCCSAGMKSCDGASCVGAGTCCSAADCPYANGSGACSGNGGSCSLAACNPGYKACNGACIPDGTCCSSADCPGTANGAGLCSGAGGSCSITCNGGYKACGGACIPNATCCGSGDCPATANGVGICSGPGGSCSLGCNMGFKLCGNQCIPNGTCCSTADCPAPANGSPVCSGVGGLCSVTCNGGYKGCGGACIPNAQCCTSADCPNDAANHRHGVCVVGGSCIFACDSGYKACGGTCIPNAACCNNGDCVTPTNGCYKTQGTCAAGGVCTYAYNDGATCNADSDACTPNDKCLSGSCVPDTANRVKCVQRDCHSAPVCNTSSGNCVDANLGDGTACGGNGCAVAVGACTGGACSVAPKDCTALNSDCKVGMCDASAAVGTPCASVNKANGLACNVADKCIIAPACNGGECVGERKTCTPSSSCHVAECNPSTGECEETVAPAGTSCANEGSSCTQNASCDVNGSCNGDLVPDGTPCDMDCGELSAACVTGACICIEGNAVKDPVASDNPDPSVPDAAADTGCEMTGRSPSTPLFWAFLAASLVIVLRRRRA